MISKTTATIWGLATILLWLTDAREGWAQTPPPASTTSLQTTTESDDADAGGSYVAGRRFRDPFKRLVDTGPVEVPDIPPLEKYSTETFKLVGVITGPENVRALLKSNDGHTYVVKETEKIGTEGGVIRKITASAVFVEELVTNEIGENERVTTEIRLLNTGKGSAIRQSTIPVTPVTLPPPVKAPTPITPPGNNPSNTGSAGSSGGIRSGLPVGVGNRNQPSTSGEASTENSGELSQPPDGQN